GKDCPMQMRATYDPATNKFKSAGYYSDGRDGYFWQMFWSYLEAYANGAKSVDGATGTSASKIGTWQITASDGLNVRTGADASTTKIGEFELGDIVQIEELNGNWGKVTLEDGQVGWCSIANYGKYISIDAMSHNVTPNSDNISYSYDAEGSLTITNASDSQGQIDFFTPLKLGTLTTPIMSLQVTPISGNGFFFGITQKGSGYWMMRDCNSGDQLVNEESAPYMVNAEKLQIDLRDWWNPEADYQVDQMRFYLAPNTTIKINYFYFASGTDVVVDPRYNLMSAATNVSLMDPSKIVIVDESQAGSYIYSNGMLTVTADTDAGFEVAFLLEQQFDVNKFKRLLVGVDAKTTYNISMLISHANGQGWVSLTADYWPSFSSEAPVNNLLPAWNGTAGLDFLSYFTYNNVLPADGMVTVHKVFVKVVNAGTTFVNGLQLTENDRILMFRDGLYAQGSSDGVIDPDPVPPVDEPETPEKGDVNGDNEISTMDARLIISYLLGTGDLSDDQKVLADFDGNSEVSTMDVRAMLMHVLGKV
ncbi:MAG: SH3 domain-containing protein, partial [Clostridia bacterium]|nr:SH3 domain-containing protein [Clostridia bacterium]